jgi:hypothetical protein
MKFLVIAHDVKQNGRCKVYNPRTIILRLNACDQLLIHQLRSVFSEFVTIPSTSLRGDGLHRWFIRCHRRSSSGPQLRHKRTWPSTETGLGQSREFPRPVMTPWTGAVQLTEKQHRSLGL